MLLRIISATFTMSVKLLSLALIVVLLLYRTDFLSAQGGSSEESAVLVPRNAEVKDDADDEDDADGDDPPTDNDGYDTPPGEEDELIYTYTIRPGDSLLRLAIRLGIPYAVLKAQTDNPSLIHPGQQFTYRDADRIDSSIPPTDDDGTDSDGYDTPPPSTDFDGISTPVPTDNDGTDSDGYDTTGTFTTDNDGTDSDGIDTTGLWTDNDGTDSDGIDTTGNATDNDGTDSDGYDTTGNQYSPVSPDSADSSVSS